MPACESPAPLGAGEKKIRVASLGGVPFLGCFRIPSLLPARRQAQRSLSRIAGHCSHLPSQDGRRTGSGCSGRTRRKEAEAAARVAVAALKAEGERGGKGRPCQACHVVPARPSCAKWLAGRLAVAGWAGKSWQGSPGKLGLVGCLGWLDSMAPWLARGKEWVGWQVGRFNDCQLTGHSVYPSV